MRARRKPSGEEVLDWMRHGLALLEAAGVDIPRELIMRPRLPAIDRPMTMEQKRSAEHVDAFVCARLERLEGAPPERAQRLYEAYLAFAADQGMAPISQTAFGRHLSKRFRKERPRGRVFYLDVRLVEVGL